MRRQGAAMLAEQLAEHELQRMLEEERLEAVGTISAMIHGCQCTTRDWQEPALHLMLVTDLEIPTMAMRARLLDQCPECSMCL